MAESLEPAKGSKPSLGGGLAAKFKAAASAAAAAAGIEKKAKARRVPNFMAATASSKNQESEERVTYVDPKESAAAKAKAALLKLRGIEGKQLRDVKAATAAEMQKWNEVRAPVRAVATHDWQGRSQELTPHYSTHVK